MPQKTTVPDSQPWPFSNDAPHEEQVRILERRLIVESDAAHTEKQLHATQKAAPVGLNASGSVKGAASPRVAMAQPGRALKVLLVEDEEQVRNVAGRVLAHAGFEAVVAKNGVEALEAIRAHEGRFDVVLSDILMPEMDGIELAVRARSEYPGLHFVFMTGFSDISRDRERANDLCDAILSKPFDVWEMVETLKRAAAPIS